MPPSSVPLRRDNGPSHSKKPPVWAITASEGNRPEIPASAKCNRPNRQDGSCCKDLLDDEDNRTLIDPEIVRDAIIGLSDGLTVPFALTAGLSSLGDSKLVVLGGIAELIAGAISMGVGGFLGSQAERDHYRFLRQQTAHRVLRSCEEEMEREVSEVLGPVGVDEKTCNTVAKCLRQIELDSQGSGPNGIVSDEENVPLRWSKEVGLTAFLLRFGEGMEEVPTKRLWISALTIGLGYLGGIIPLLPYFFIPKASEALIYSCIITGVILLVFGAVKARVTGAGADGVWSYVRGAITTLFVGGIAAGASFGIVRALEG